MYCIKLTFNTSGNMYAVPDETFEQLMITYLTY